MLSFDNVNTAMPDYISDIICRLTTGQGFRTGKGCDRIRDVKFVFNSYKNPEKHVMGEPTLMQIIKDLEGKI